jgi:hypothetical protein
LFARGEREGCAAINAIEGFIGIHVWVYNLRKKALEDQLVIPGFADNATRPLRLCLISIDRRSG